MGEVTRDVAIEDVGPHIMGYTAANDVTARDLQRLDGQWTRAKGFDTFCPLGPVIDTELDPQESLSIVAESTTRSVSRRQRPTWSSGLVSWSHTSLA